MRATPERPSILAIALSFLILLLIAVVAFRWTRYWWRLYAALVK